MALFDKLNDNIAIRIADALGKYHRGFFTKRVLKTMSEVEANTNVKNLASAVVVKELNNQLVSDIYVSADGKLHKVKGGADTVLNFSSTLVTQAFSKNISTSGYQIPTTITKDGITYKYVGVKSLQLNSTLSSGGNYAVSVNETGFVSLNSPLISGALNGIALYNI